MHLEALFKLYYLLVVLVLKFLHEITVFLYQSKLYIYFTSLPQFVSTSFAPQILEWFFAWGLRVLLPAWIEVGWASCEFCCCAIQSTFSFLSFRFQQFGVVFCVRRCSPTVWQVAPPLCEDWWFHLFIFFPWEWIATPLLRTLHLRAGVFQVFLLLPFQPLTDILKIFHPSIY